MRIFFLLKITTYLLNNYDWDDQNPVEISFEDRGLTEHIEDEVPNKKVYSLYPSVQVVEGKLWGVMTAGLTEALSGEETAELLEFVTGQNSDGYGGVLEQRPIKTPDSIIHVSFWNNDKNYSIKTEQELKKSPPAPGSTVL